MQKRNIIMLVMLMVGVTPCFGAVRSYSQQTTQNRRGQRTFFTQPQARIAQVADDKNNFIAPQPTDAVDVSAPDIAPEVIPEDIIIKQPAPATNKEDSLFTDAELSEIISSLNDIVAALDSEISTLDGEIIRCKQEKKTSTILTVVGAAGTLGTGIGAVVQGKKLHDAKKAGATEKQEQQGTSE